ncbi:MAG TPA: ABC transporter permease [Candidatus Limnocylindrales bacterium]|jgi:putative spermidine/putrescine transport system permease protein|nr:ABC transporter permease [Candidatus Limnocylindrales bacterium]
MTATNASTTIRDSPLRRISAALYRRPRLVLGALLTPPVLWLVVIYLGSLGLLFLSSLWHLDPVTSRILRDPTLANFQEVFSPDKPYLRVAQHTVGIAAIVTIADALLAFPLAYYMARVASPRTRSILFIAATIPLWISYLVRVYSWRIILADGGFLDWALGSVGLKGPGALGDVPIAVVFTYIWLPYMVLPLYAGLERIPRSLLEASSDLGGRSWTTFRRIVFPLAFPGLVAGSIFTFSLTLGDYITPTLFSGEQFIGNVIYSNVGVAGNVPLAAAYAIVPVAVVAVYLVFARRLGAFEAL